MNTSYSWYNMEVQVCLLTHKSSGSRLDPEAVAYDFYGWLMILYSWLAGLAEQATAGSGQEN